MIDSTERRADLERETSAGLRSFLGLALLVVAGLLPSLAYWLYLPQFGRLEYNDYYPIINQVTEGDHFVHNPMTWLRMKSNEHTVTLPALAYAVNASLTHGDNRGLSAFSLILLTGSLLLLAGLLPAGLRSPPLLAAGVGLTMGLLVFNMVQSHNVVMGFSGAIWFLSNFFALGAIYCLYRGHKSGRRIWLVLCLVSGLLGALSYSTNLSLWPALVVASLALRVPRRWKLAIIGTAVVVLVLYFATYHTPPWSPHPNTSHPGTLVEYAAVYLGGLAFSRVGAATVLGGVLLLLAAGLAAAVVLYGDASLRRSLVPWFAIQVYVLGNCLGTAVGRSSSGLAQAFSSRYASLPALFWLAFLVQLGAAARFHVDGDRLSRIARETLGAVAVFALLLPVAVNGVDRYRGHLRSAARQPLAEMALRFGVNDVDAVKIFLPWPPHLVKSLPFLRATHHIPFDRPPDPEIGRALPDGEVEAARHRAAAGALTGSEPVSQSVARVRGWLVVRGPRVNELLLVNQKGVVRGKGFPGFDPPPGSRPPDGATVAGWRGYVHTVAGDVVTAFARLRPDGSLRPLDGTLPTAPSPS